MKIIDQLPPWLKNKYIITACLFGIWLLFFDDRDVVSQLRHSRELTRLEESRDYYVEEIRRTAAELDKLKSDPATLEKYAREKYRMKKDEEDLFIIATPESR
ncbi:MAG: septum formation initiator family protein [Chitinophagaceae bacterium]|nr:MAG: septum formation initiator family protein [Chitinophagaceae bacterium]